MITKTVKKFGHGSAHIVVPYDMIGKEVSIYTEEEIDMECNEVHMDKSPEVHIDTKPIHIDKPLIHMETHCKSEWPKESEKDYSKSELESPPSKEALAFVTEVQAAQPLVKIFKYDPESLDESEEDFIERYLASADQLKPVLMERARKQFKIERLSILLEVIKKRSIVPNVPVVS